MRVLRERIFVCVHEQFMTETAEMADIILPATMFLEHDDVYQAGGHQHITLGPKIVNPPEGCRSNHEVICALAKRLGAKHPGFELTPEKSLTERCRTQAGVNLRIWNSNTGSTASPTSRKRTISKASATPTGDFTSHPTGMLSCHTVLVRPVLSCPPARSLGRY